MRVNNAGKLTASQAETRLAALAKFAAASFEQAERRFESAVAPLEARLLHHHTALESISQGICFFGSDSKLILSNRRYAEIYGLAPDAIWPGLTLLEITQLRYATGSCPDMSIEAYVQSCMTSMQNSEGHTKTLTLRDGRSIAVFHQTLQGGGYVATHDDITESQNKKNSLQTLLDWAPDYLWIKDMNSRFIIANKQLVADSGLDKSRDMKGLSDFDLHPRERAQIFFDEERAILQSGHPIIDREEFVESAEGGKKWILSTKVPVRDDSGQIIGLVGIARDITERRQAAELRESQWEALEKIAMGTPLKEVLEHLIRFTQSQLAGIVGSVVLLDQDGLHLRSAAAPDLPEPVQKAADGLRIGPFAGACGTAVFRAAPVICADIASDPLWEGHRSVVEPYGYKSCWATPILSHQGGVLGAFAMYSLDSRAPTAAEIRLIDMTIHIASIAIERQRNEERIQFLANHDALTGLPNRILLKDRLAQAISFADRYERCVSVVFIDLDNFKTVNDSLGHTAGDELLKTVAARMSRAVLSIDTLVRLGGDEFVIILSDQTKNGDEVSAKLQKIRAAIAEPIILSGHALRVTASIGVANYPADGVNVDMLLANADAAMYRAKEIGRDNFQFYTPELNASVHAKFLLQEELCGALSRGEFFLNYQPQVDLRSGRIFAVEALIRWKHPKLGIVSPATFIPVAEETGLIIPIGEWVLKKACQDNKAWHEAGFAPIKVCVNVSARQFKEENWVDRVKAIVGATELDPQYLELELTESLIMQDAAQAIGKMKDMQDSGIQLSIDDFGTGYSSLSALKNFPVARLKIDKTFVDDLLTNDTDRAVISAVISLGHSLQMRVIAEGVETDDQMAFLLNQNCDEMQGYHFSKPVVAQAITQMLREQASRD